MSEGKGDLLRFYLVRVANLTTMSLLAKSKQDAVEEVLRTPSVQKILERLCVVSLGEKA
jgi:hypothetical protein